MADESFVVTLGEVWRTVQRMESTLSELVRTDQRATIAALERRVSTLETWHTWILRTIVGAITLAVVAAAGFAGAA